MNTGRHKKGRPAGAMTTRRRQVLDALADAAEGGERVTWARIARRCGLYDYRAARRIARDLEAMGRL